jgi:hypothetical protein
MTYMKDAKTAKHLLDEISVGGSATQTSDTVEGDGFETVYPKMSVRKNPCGRVVLKTHFSTFICEREPDHEPPCESRGIRR